MALALTHLDIRRTYSDENEGEIQREGFDPRQLKTSSRRNSVVVEDEEEEEDRNRREFPEELNEARHWSRSDESKEETMSKGKTRIGRWGDDGNVWDGHSGRSS